MDRAYALLTVKAVEEDKRIIRGTATTPQPDRLGDIVEPMGVKFKNPLPLLHQHRSDEPVGTVRFDRPTDEGITFEAKLPKIDEAGPLKDRVDTAWGEIKSGLVRAVSIGFRAIERAFMDDGGIRFIQSEVLELSLVTVPANATATITEIRSIDAELLAAVDGTKHRGAERNPPVVSGSTKLVQRKGTKMKTIAEQIAAFEATRQAKAARMEDLMSDAAEKGETLDAEQSQEYDEVAEQVKSVDDHLNRLRDLEKAKATTAKAVERIETAARGSDARDPRVYATVKAAERVDPGIRFARLARVKALSKLQSIDVARMAEMIYPNDETIVRISKAAVAAATTSNSTWAGALVSDESAVFADFVEFLRPMTILGKFGTNGIPGLRRVPFRVPLITQTTGGSGYWVGEGKPKPLTKFDFTRTTLEPLKVANIAVATMETLRDSSPSAETIIRDSLAAALRERLDIDFIDPDKAASAGVSPASISNGITALSSDGNDADSVREDMRSLFAGYIAADNPPTSGVWIMSATTALSLSLMMNTLGQQEFPGLSMNGGTFLGLPVIVSEYVTSDSNGHFVFLVNSTDIYLADEGGIQVDMSQEASLQMDDSPTNDASTGTGASLVSLWQTNSVGFRAERTINWARRRASAVAIMDSVNWGEPAS